MLILLISLLLIHRCKHSSNPITPEKELNYQIVFASDRDSDGRVNIEMGEEGEIYSMFTDGSNLKRLTYNDNYDYAPLYSSDGEHIVFRSAEDWLMNNVVIMNADGTSEINLGRGNFPKFSNDNSKILYQTGGLVGLINTDGSNKVVLTHWADSIYSNLGQDYPVQFSSDDLKILFLSRKDNNGDIYTMLIDGTNVQRLTSEPGYDGVCSFSNDDTEILFSSYRTGVSQIYIMDSDGNNVKQLTTTEAFNTNASFSPNGNEIVFESYRDSQSEIYLMNRDGSNQRRLTYTNSNKGSISFSPDGKYIIYSQKERDNLNANKYDICLINIASGETVNLTNGEGNNYVPSFSPILK